MRSAKILGVILALVSASVSARADVSIYTTSETNGRTVVELVRHDQQIAIGPVYFYTAISPSGTYTARFRVGPAPAPGMRVAAGPTVDSLTVSAPIPFRGARIVSCTVRFPQDVMVGNVTIDYTPAANVADAAHADPLVRTLVVNRTVFPYTPRAAANDPWFSRAPFWMRLTVGARGMHAVTGSDLAAAGVSLGSIDPASLRLFTGGGENQPRSYEDSTATWASGHAMREVAIRVESGGDGTFDPADRVVFYGMPSQDWSNYYEPGAPDSIYHEHTHAKSTVYFLAWGGSLGGTPARMADVPSAPTAAGDVTTYLHREYRERDLFNDYNYRGDGWLWLDLGTPSTSRTVLASVDVRNLVTSQPQQFRSVALAKYVSAQDPTGSNFGHRAVYFDFRGGQEVQIGDKVWDGNGGDNYYEAGRPVVITGSFLQEGSNQFRIQMPGNLNLKDRQLFAWFAVWYERRITASGGSVGFSSPDTSGTVNFRADGFAGAEPINAFDVTDAWSPSHLTGVEETTAGSRRVRFSASHNGERHFWVATNSGYIKPAMARLTPDDLRAATTGPDMLIITHPAFRAAAERLRSYRAAGRVPLVDSPVVEIATTDDIFDNFSQGVPDPMALRNYIKFLFDNYPDANGNPRLAYVCFLGDASTDFRNNSSQQIDYVPSNLYFARLTPFAFATDEWYGQMDAQDQVPGGDVLDIAIGRLPAETEEEADFLVDRCIRYETEAPFEHWRDEVILVADDELSSLPGCETRWSNESDELAQYDIGNFADITKIYLAEYQQIGGVKPGSRFDFLDAWNDGALMINFIGHGSSQQMADEQVFLGSDVSQLSNGLKLPMVSAFSCTIGDFANPAGKSLSEKLLLHSAGGAIATLTSSNESYPDPNKYLHQSYFARVLPQELGREIVPVGVGVLHGKAEAQGRGSFGPYASENSWKYNLLCDPALTLRIPKREIRFETAGAADTLVAGTRETVRGRVYVDGAPDPGFTGTARVIVREPMINRLFRTRCSSNEFWKYILPGGIMYEGTTDVTNGAFEVSFRVPRYAGTGPLAVASAYAHEGTVDAAATLDSTLVVVAPTQADSLALQPVDGAPRVNLGFKSGLTVVKPGDTVRAVVRDQDGINILLTTNEGRQAILIDKLPLPIDVNEFFTFDHGGVDTSGVLLFPLPDLASGPHRLVYKVSDSFGSTTLDTLSFQVADEQNYYAEAVLNYPNPFETSTQLLFRLSNRAAIKLDIYTVSGKRVRSIQETRDGGEQWLEWNGRDESGDDLANGTYLYVATVDFVGLERAPVVLRGKMAKVR